MLPIDPRPMHVSAEWKAKKEKVAHDGRQILLRRRRYGYAGLDIKSRSRVSSTRSWKGKDKVIGVGGRHDSEKDLKQAAVMIKPESRFGQDCGSELDIGGSKLTRDSNSCRPRTCSTGQRYQRPLR